MHRPISQAEYLSSDRVFALWKAYVTLSLFIALIVYVFSLFGANDWQIFQVSLFKMRGVLGLLVDVCLAWGAIALSCLMAYPLISQMVKLELSQSDSFVMGGMESNRILNLLYACFFLTSLFFSLFLVELLFVCVMIGCILNQVLLKALLKIHPLAFRLIRINQKTIQ